MGLLPSAKEEERVGNRWVKEKEVSSHLLNRKADRKLGFVAKLYSMAIGDKMVMTKSSILNRDLYVEGFHFIKYLNLNYTYENRFWAISYNLNHKTTIDSLEVNQKKDYCRFVAKNIGKMGITDALWVDSGSQCSEEERKIYLNELNNRLIIDRIVNLDMTNVEVLYTPNMNCWTISCRTLIGSTTWILIPPVMNLIKPNPIECAKMIEFFELVANAVTKVNKSGGENDSRCKNTFC